MQLLLRHGGTGDQFRVEDVVRQDTNLLTRRGEIVRPSPTPTVAPTVPQA